MAEGHEPQPYGMIDKSSSITVDTTYITKGTNLWCYVVGNLAVCSINFRANQDISGTSLNLISGLPKPIKIYAFSVMATENLGGRMLITGSGDIRIETPIRGPYWYNGILVYPIA